MERILRNKEIFEIIPFDYKSNVLYFPIRHHSPACSYHLLNVIKEYQPDCILVEGPQNANKLIPILTDEETILPIAFYYFYKDKSKLINNDADDYKCYYPFLNTSPEYNALVEAKRLGINGEFIDLPYAEILINTQRNKGIRKETEVQNYNDDYYLSENNFFNSICQKTGMRSFEEFWEKFFEIDALYTDTEDFVAKMLSYCYLTRENTPTEIMEQDGCLLREQFMAENIIEATKKYSKVLVVTGGFHTYGIYNLINSSDKIKKVKLHKFDEKVQNVYAMAYSFEAADALNGYASGMQNPGFYESIWKEMNKNNIDKAYSDIVLETVIKTAKKSNKKNILITMSDISSAVVMCEGLYLLREKKAPGLYELYDCVKSCFIKGELNQASDIPLRLLNEIATGSNIGELCNTAEKVPLLINFEEMCLKYRLKIETVIEQKIELDIFSKKNHMEISRFLYQMNFLGTSFARKIKGADIIRNTDRSRIRELWSYSRSVSTDTALIDCSVYGGTIKEACKVLATRKIKKEQKCSEAAKLYVECFLMGIDISVDFASNMNNIIINDGDFFSIGKAIYYFNTLNSLKKMYNSTKFESEYFLEKCFNKIIIMLPSMINVNSEYSSECIKICKILYNLVSNDLFKDKADVLIQAFVSMIDKDNPEPALYGAVLGLLYGNNVDYKKNINNALYGYLTGSEDLRKKGAVFLRGLFCTARDIIIVGDKFISMINELIRSFEMSDFMEILPELKLAFSYFTPAEIDEISEKVALIYNTTTSKVKENLDIYNSVFSLGSQLEKQICSDMDGIWNNALEV